MNELERVNCNPLQCYTIKVDHWIGLPFTLSSQARIIIIKTFWPYDPESLENDISDAVARFYGMLHIKQQIKSFYLFCDNKW